MNILFVGDVVGAPGRRALGDALEGVIDRKQDRLHDRQRRERRRAASA